jgi:hypothetical protein
MTDMSDDMPLSPKPAKSLGTDMPRSDEGPSDAPRSDEGHQTHQVPKRPHRTLPRIIIHR